MKLKLFMFTLIFFGCTTNETGRQQIITSVGIYTLNDKNERLIVQKDGGILRFFLTDKIGNAKLISNSSISIYQNWGMFYDDLSNLWVHSADVGDYVYLKKKQTYFKTFIKKNDSIYKKMPITFKNYIDKRTK